jgi:hypothetical protein
MWASALAVLALCAAAQTALAQASASGGSSAPSAALSADRLVERYSDLAGSRENAKALIAGLREGIQFTLSSGNRSATFHPPAVKMSESNIDNALALARASLTARAIDQPTPDQVGTTVMDVVQMRLEGKGWPQVADALGFKSPK